jgi:putative membrane protein
MNTTYNDYPHRRHIFGWILLGLLALFVVGSLVIFGLSVATGHLVLPFYRPLGFFFFFPIGFLFFIFIVFIVLRLAFWGSWWGWRGGYRRGYWGDPKEILRMRYARGEITKEQFDQMLRDLDEHKST